MHCFKIVGYIAVVCGGWPPLLVLTSHFEQHSIVFEKIDSLILIIVRGTVMAVETVLKTMYLYLINTLPVRQCYSDT